MERVGEAKVAIISLSFFRCTLLAEIRGYFKMNMKRYIKKKHFIYLFLFIIKQESTRWSSER